jgi:hypothetical protein
MATTVLFKNVAVSVPVTSPAVLVNTDIASASYTLTMTSPNTPLAEFEFVVEISTDNQTTWGIVGDHGFQNVDTGAMWHGVPIPIVQTDSVTVELPDYALGNYVRLRVITVNGGTWKVSASVLN